MYVYNPTRLIYLKVEKKNCISHYFLEESSDSYNIYLRVTEEGGLCVFHSKYVLHVSVSLRTTEPSDGRKIDFRRRTQ